MRSAERQYQLAAQKRDAQDRKFNYYNETAKYFERESGKAKQFNMWNVENIKQTHWENLQKDKALKLRQNRLRELLKNDDKLYEEERKKLERKHDKKKLSLEELKNQLKEKRAELSLYKPENCRRIKSYFMYPTQIERQPFQELHEFSNNSNKNNNNKNNNNNNNNNNNGSSIISTENSSEIYNLSQDKNENSSLSKTNLNSNQDAYNERSNAYQENRLKSLSSKFKYFYDDLQPIASLEKSKHLNQLINNNNNNNNNNNSNNISTSSVKRFSPNMLYGNRIYMSDENINPRLNKKYTQRYSRRSLESTNISNSYSFDYSNDIQKKQKNLNKVRQMETDCRNENSENSEKNFNNLKINSEEIDNNEVINYEENHLMNNNEKNNHEESCSVQLMNNSEDREKLMLIYLNDNDIKRKIQDLEFRERRSSMKHLWEEALRLRDMRNRLELLREKQIYQKNDLHIDPHSREEALKHLEIRSKQLKNRENVCADSSMYSEEAKLTWNQWLEEDRQSPIKNFDRHRDVLLKQLEEEWLQLTEKDKKIISQTHNNIMTDSSMQNELKLLAKKGLR